MPSDTYRLSAPSEGAVAFSQAMGREMLASERRRTGLVLGVLLSAMAAFLIITVLFPAVMETVFRGRLDFRIVSISLVLILAIETLIFVAQTNWLRAGRQPPAFARYLNALIETSLPTAALIVSADIFEPAYGLVSPPLLLYFIFIGLATLRLDFALCVFTGAVAAAEYVALAGVLLRAPPPGLDPLLTSATPHLARGAMLLVAGLVAGFVAQQIRQQIANTYRSVAERNRVVGMFGQHVSPEVVDKLLAQDVDLGGEIRHVCLMFVDIRGFTAFAENRSPSEVVAYLNHLFGFMIDSVNRHHGIVNKFLGDGFMAVFGAPLPDPAHTINAVAAAREILARVDQLNAAGRLPPTRIGIGLHAGEAVTGNVGSERRKEYTLIGDAVNLASRIEQLNKQYGSRLLVSEAVWRAFDQPPTGAKALGLVDVRGHAAPVRVYQLS